MSSGRQPSQVVIVVAAVQICLLCGPIPAGAQHYGITDLGLLPNGYLTEARAINARRQIVGTSEAPLRGFFWEKGDLQDIGTLGGSLAVAFGINDRSEIVGASMLPGDEILHAFIWRAGEFRDLGTLADGTQSIGFAINNRGQVVGVADTGADVHTFLWHQSTGMLDLGPLSLGGDPDMTRPRAINNQGQIVGVARDEGTNNRAFLWDDGVMIALGGLGGAWSDAYDINQRGEIVGVASTPDELASYAIRWSNGEAEFLGTLGRWSAARAINNRGEIVGLTDSRGYTHAFVWRDGLLQDLNDLVPAKSGWRLFVANDISNSGHIVGIGHINEEWHAFLLTPVRRHAAAQLVP